MHKKNLSHRQMQVLPILLQYSTIEEAARQANISAKQIHEWMKDEIFRRELSSRRQQLFESSLETIKSATSRAVVTLISLLDDENPRIRLSSADKILSHAYQSHELLHLEEKIKSLEERFDKMAIQKKL